MSWEGLINGQLVEVQILEESCKDSVQFIKFTPIGNHQYQLTRHWLQQAKQNIVLM